MKTQLFFASLFLAVCLVPFYAVCQKTVIPLNESIEPDGAYTIIWNGISKAYRYRNENWSRDESYDYQFNVVQKRYDNHWKSIKTLHRIHPEYDGKAGDRDQTMYFEVIYKTLKEQTVQSEIQASIGNGTGTSDPEFRVSELTIYIPNPSRFLPYNKFRITQNYDYEAGKLTETVELLLEKDGKETPFMKNEETAWIFIKSTLNKAPTTFKE